MTAATASRTRLRKSVPTSPDAVGSAWTYAALTSLSSACAPSKGYYEKVWLPEKRRSCKSTTLAGYMGYFRKYLLPEFDDCNLYDIRPFDIQEYFQSIPHLTLKTQKEHYNVLSNLFDYAMDDENVALPRNPVKSKYVKVKYSESDSVIREPLPSEVVTEIVSQIGTLPLMERRLMALLLFTGMRRGEVLGLRWEDLDFKTGFITVRRNATYAHNQAEVTTPKHATAFAAFPSMHNSSKCSERPRNPAISSASRRRPSRERRISACSRRFAKPLICTARPPMSSATAI